MRLHSQCHQHRNKAACKQFACRLLRQARTRRSDIGAAWRTKGRCHASVCLSQRTAGRSCCAGFGICWGQCARLKSNPTLSPPKKKRKEKRGRGKKTPLPPTAPCEVRKMTIHDNLDTNGLSLCRVSFLSFFLSFYFFLSFFHSLFFISFFFFSFFFSDFPKLGNIYLSNVLAGTAILLTFFFFSFFLLLHTTVLEKYYCKRNIEF